MLRDDKEVDHANFKLTFCKWVCRPSSPQCFTNPNIALCAKLEGKFTVWLCNSTYLAIKSSGPVTHPTRIPGLRIFDTVSIRITRPSVSSDRKDLCAKRGKQNTAVNRRKKNNYTQQLAPIFL